MRLKADIDYLIHYSGNVPKFVTVYRPLLPWELWSVRNTVEYGKLTLVSELCYGAEDKEKFSKENLIIVSDYTEAENHSLKLAIMLGLIS